RLRAADDRRPLRRGTRHGVGRHHDRLPGAHPAYRRIGERVSAPGFRLSPASTWGLRVIVAVVLVFVYVPLVVVVINSFNADVTFSWPPQEFTLEWWKRAKDNSGMVEALQQSIK